MVPRKFITFTCTGQSGHTIIAAILDAHPHVMVSEEKMVIRKMAKGRFKTPVEMFEHVIYDSRTRVQGKNSYRRKIGTIEGQGQYEGTLEVLGDKCGWDVIGRYKDRGTPNTSLLDFEQSIGVPVYVVHALRNPFDVISNWYVGKRNMRGDLEGCISAYGELTHAIQKVYYDSGFPRERILQVPNEALCAVPIVWIEALANHLDLEVDREWLRRCRDKVFQKPNSRVSECKWTRPLIDRVNEEIIKPYEFHKGYTSE